MQCLGAFILMVLLCKLSVLYSISSSHQYLSQHAFTNAAHSAIFGLKVHLVYLVQSMTRILIENIRADNYSHVFMVFHETLFDAVFSRF